MVGYPIVWACTVYSRPIRFDDLFGSLSYGIFLDHFLCIWLYGNLHQSCERYHTDDPAAIVGILTLSIALAGVGYLLIDRPIRAARRFVRTRHAVPL